MAAPNMMGPKSDHDLTMKSPVWYSHRIQPKQVEAWQRASASSERKRSSARGSVVLGLNSSFWQRSSFFEFFFLCIILVWKQLRDFRSHQRVQHPGAQLFRQRDALTSPLVQAWPPPSYPHSRGCKRHTKRDLKRKENNISLCSLLVIHKMRLQPE